MTTDRPRASVKSLEGLGTDGWAALVDVPCPMSVLRLDCAVDAGRFGAIQQLMSDGARTAAAFERLALYPSLVVADWTWVPSTAVARRNPLIPPAIRSIAASDPIQVQIDEDSRFRRAAVVGIKASGLADALVWMARHPSCMALWAEPNKWLTPGSVQEIAEICFGFAASDHAQAVWTTITSFLCRTRAVAARYSGDFDDPVSRLEFVAPAELLVGLTHLPAED